MGKKEGVTYAQWRLILGVSNVGFWVVLASIALKLGWPGEYLPLKVMTGGRLLTRLGLIFAGYIALQVPFDVIGGLVLPMAFRRFYGDFSDFISTLARGIVVQTAIFAGVAVSILMQPEWVLIICFGWMVGLQALQRGIAWITGTFHFRGENGWKSLDDAFTGGITGLPGFQKAIFVTGRGQRLRAMDERRRHHILRMSLPMAGVVIAVTFNWIGIVLVSRMTAHPLNTLAGIVEMALGFTLWSFLGLLVLPSCSRPAVYAGDYALYAKGISREEFEQYLRSDNSQADEESRGAWIERIFHPVPSPENRLQRWGRAPGWGGGWHAARYAIYLSWAGLSLISRSVHCNVGKPNVWVMLPCD